MKWFVAIQTRRLCSSGAFDRMRRDCQLNYAVAIVSLLVHHDPVAAARLIAMDVPIRWASRKAAKVRRRWNCGSTDVHVNTRFPIGEL
jgi:hypothetical protein